MSEQRANPASLLREIYQVIQEQPQQRPMTCTGVLELRGGSLLPITLISHGVWASLWEQKLKPLGDLRSQARITSTTPLEENRLYGRDSAGNLWSIPFDDVTNFAMGECKPKERKRHTWKTRSPYGNPLE